MTDFELLDFKIGDIAIKDMTTPTFLGIISRKLNGITQNSPISNELMLMVTHPPIGMMSVENKIEVIRKLEKLEIELW